MQWNSLGEILALGGYGTYVWTALGVTVLCMTWEVLALRRRGGAAGKWTPRGRMTDTKSP